MRTPCDPMRRLGRGAVILAAAFLAATPGLPADYFLAVDVPAHLGTVDYTPDQFVLDRGGTYSLAASLPPGLQIGALHRRSDGSWLFSPAHPATLGGTDYQPRDVVAYDGSSYTLFLDGNAAGIPSDARIDAIGLDAAAGPVFLSFDVPVYLSGVNFAPVDIVKFASGAFSMDWNGVVAGVPLDANVVGFSMDAAGHRVLTFDIPTNLAGSDYLPGDLVQWNAGTFSLYARDASWPREAQLRDFSFLPPSGEVPSDADTPGGPLTVTKASGSDLRLRWSASCRTDDTDYEIYEGSIGGGFANHNPKVCSTGGSVGATITPALGSSYYLVAPRNAVAEGSHGHRSDGSERAVALRCLPQAAAACSIGP